MRLKDYQREALERVEAFAKAVAAANDELAATEQARAALSAEMRAKLLQGQEAPPVTAWKAMQAVDARVSLNAWVSLLDGWRRDIPHVCLEMPTGSGKTLVAGHAVGRINAALDRRRTGLVLWIVPSDAIYRQTLGLLRDRGNGVRIALETASGGAAKILQKGDGFTAADVETQLCVMILMLQSTGRKDKETLKVFRDSGAYGSFFPQVDDVAALTALKTAVPNLDGYDVADGVPPAVVASGVKYSLGNLLRVARPIIILDEGHRAYSVTARDAGGDEPALPDGADRDARSRAFEHPGQRERSHARRRTNGKAADRAVRRREKLVAGYAGGIGRAVAQGADASRYLECRGGGGTAYPADPAGSGRAHGQGSARRRAYPYRRRLRGTDAAAWRAGRMDQAANRDR